MVDWLSAAAATPLFKGIPPHRIQELLRDGREEALLPRGTSLSYGAGTLGIVVSGRLGVKNASGALLNELTPGAMFGVSAIFTEYRFAMTTISASVASTVLLIREPTLERIFSEEPLANRNYLCFLTDRIRFLNWKIDLFTASSAEERLKLYLLHRRKDGNLVQVEPLARLGATLSLGRASLYRAIEKLCGEGVLSRIDRGVFWVDWERLF